MKYFQKLVSGCLSLALIGGLFVPSFALSQYSSYEDEVRTNEVEGQIQINSEDFFSDMDSSLLEGRAAAYLHGLGIIGGFPDGEFKGDRLVNRAELAKFLLLASVTTVEDIKNNGTFPDVKEGEWYVPFVMKAHEKGVINGYPDGLFRPAKSVNTAEALKMATKAFSLEENMNHDYTDVTASDWFDPYAGMASFYTLFPERSNTLLEPASLLTRNEVAVMIYQYLTWGMVNADTPPNPPAHEDDGDGYDPVSNEIPAEAQEAVQYLIDHHIISENDFSPNTAIDLATAAEWLVKTKNMTPDLGGGVSFPDLSVSHPGYTYLKTLYNYNIWSGEPTGKMLPDKNISRAEAAKLIVNGFELVNSVGRAQYIFKDVKPADWFFDYAWIVYKNNLMTTIAKIEFGPHENISEAKFAKILYDANNLIADEVSLVENGLSVALSSQTPAQQNIIDCSEDVVFTTFDMSAGEGDIRLETITVTRMGVGDNDDFDNVRIERNGTAITNEKSFNNDDVAEFTFPAWFRIQSGTTETFNIVADVKCSGNRTNVGHYSSFIIKDEPSITSSALVVSGDFPIEGNKMEIVSETISSVVPRISFWYGKVNQHNEDGVWKTDPDGVSGGGTQAQWGDEGWADRPVEYCQKFWPNTTSVSDFGEETINTWCTRGNTNCTYTSTRMSYECVKGEAESVLEISRSDGFEDGEVIIAGLDDISVLKFLLDNNDGGDVDVLTVSIKMTGTGNATNFSSFVGALFVDGTQQGSSKYFNSSGNIHFNDLVIIIPDAGQKEFDLVVNTNEPSAPGTVKFYIHDVEAGNFDNDTSVITIHSGQILSESNSVEGAEFELMESGELSVQRGVVIPGRDLLPGEEDIDILNIHAEAQYDDIDIKDFYFMNDVDGDGVADNTGISELVEFKLYNNEGDLVQTKQMIEGMLHFELANQDRIRVLQNGSMVATIKGYVREFQENQAGEQLRIVLDQNIPHKGIEAISLATGSDIPTPENGWGMVESEIFTTVWQEL